jgi:hypothetical protein
VDWVRFFRAAEAGLEVGFDRRFTIPKRRVDASTVRFGEAEPGWRLEGGESGVELVWTRGPRTLTVPGSDGPVSFTIGAETTVFAGETGPLGATPRDVYLDFLPAHPIGSAAARFREGDTELAVATDGDLETAWTIPRKGWGQAELTVQLASTQPVRMIRWVPGCAADARAWSTHAEVDAVRVQIGGTLEIEVDRSSPETFPPGVKAWGDFPLSDAFGRQVLVFLDRPRRAGWVRITPLRPRRSGQSARPACIAEIDLH